LQWFGACPSCGAAGTLTETITERPSRGTIAVARQSADSVLLGNIRVSEAERLATGIGELDRVLGGGMVAGQVVLIGGDPGIGKSTLLLQALSALGNGSKTLYISGEESAEQVALRAKRLGVDTAPVRLVAEIQLERIAAALDAHRPQVAVVDSIQTLWSEALQSAPDLAWR
jgi:DNA repair protein RadA/Sms